MPGEPPGTFHVPSLGQLPLREQYSFLQIEYSVSLKIEMRQRMFCVTLMT